MIACGEGLDTAIALMPLVLVVALLVWAAGRP
jgi:hypothetical protein